ncbi:MAG: single-stranded-DNA-specific exonuclease RecJ, partial [Microgenomates group bacterium]
MKWNILSSALTGNKEEIIKTLLENRGVKTKKEIEKFLHPVKPEDFTAKDLGIDAKEVKKALARIKKAIDEKEGIVVYGDYDADGICATAILWETLYRLTKNVLPYIPERVSEGYGLNKETIKNLKFNPPAGGKNLGLIITVDHGITSAEKIKYAKKLGIDIIVCDHHQPPKEKPKCTAVVHTEKICAAAIAWFLSNRIQSTTNHQPPITNYLDLVAIATVADLEPLTGVNRSFAKYGLQALNETKRCGLLAIMEESGIKQGEIDTYEVGYIIAPRLNAMGRMEHALESLRLLCTGNREKAKDLAAKLGLTNRERQLLTEETTKHALESFRLRTASPTGDKGQAKLIFIEHETYNQGIIGLVAGKLVEEFHRPSIVVSKGEVYSKASARSINGFNIIEAIRAQSDLLVEAGGHPMAAGFTVETAKIELLKQRLVTLADSLIPEEILEKTLKIDLRLPLEKINLQLWQAIQQMSPFGLGNPEPVFVSKAVIKNFRTVGNEGKHLKIVCQSQKTETNSQPIIISGVAFNQGGLAEQ